MRFLKVSLFSFVCAILFCIMRKITQVEPILVLAILSACVSAGSLVLWICQKMLYSFKYSINIVIIIIFATLSIFCGIVNPEKFYIENLTEIENLGYMSIAFLSSVSATFLSIIILVGRIIAKMGTTSTDNASDNPEDNKIG